MSYHEELTTLSEIIHGIDYRSDSAWYDIMGVEIEGLAEADDESATKIEEDYIRQHGRDQYRVSWPAHVQNRRYNSDATFQLEG